ncbi:nucleotidyl transferase AbiEii/AbiGii toxin family protein [soil metagenome]
MDYPNDFKEFIQLLNEKNVEYLIVGGYAVAHHGYPRYTGDIDIWFKISVENIKNLRETLLNFGFGALNVTDEDLLTSETVIQLGYPPVRIDLMNFLDGVNFDSCFERKNIGSSLGFAVNYIGLEDLKKNKSATKRHRDLDDLEHL